MFLHRTIYHRLPVPRRDRRNRQDADREREKDIGKHNGGTKRESGTSPRFAPTPTKSERKENRRENRRSGKK